MCLEDIRLARKMSTVFYPDPNIGDVTLPPNKNRVRLTLSTLDNTDGILVARNDGLGDIVIMSIGLSLQPYVIKIEDLGIILQEQLHITGLFRISPLVVVETSLMVE